MAVNSLRALLCYMTLWGLSIGLLLAWDTAFEPAFARIAGGVPRAVTVASALTGTLVGVARPAFGLLTDTVPIARFGWRRPWNVVGMALVVLSLWCIAGLGAGFGDSGATVALYAFFNLARAVGLMIAFSAVDGLTVDASLPESAGLLTAFQMLGRGLGVMIGAAIGAAGRLNGGGGVLGVLGVLLLLLAAANVLVAEERVAGGGAGGAYAHVPTDRIVNVSAGGEAADAHVPAPVGSGLAPEVKARLAARGPWALLRDVAGERPMLALCGYAALSSFGAYVGAEPVLVWLRSYAVVPASDVQWIAVVSGAGTLIGGVPFAWAFDLVAEKRILLAAAAVTSAVAFFSYVIAGGQPAGVFLAQGFIAAANAAWIATVASLLRASADERIGGGTFGLVFGAGAAGAGLGALTSLAVSSSWLLPEFIVGGLAALAAAALVPLIRFDETYAPPVELPPGVLHPDELEAVGSGAAAGRGGLLDALARDAGAAGGGSAAAHAPVPYVVDSGAAAKETAAAAQHPRLAALARAVGISPASVADGVARPADAVRSLLGDAQSV